MGGILCATVGGIFLGCGALFFAVGATLGFSGAIWKEYCYSLSQAMVGLERFPSLMLMHLDANFPLHKWRTRTTEEGLQRRRFGWLERSMLVTAWQSAGPTVEVGHFLYQFTDLYTAMGDGTMRFAIFAKGCLALTLDYRVCLKLTFSRRYTRKGRARSFGRL